MSRVEPINPRDQEERRARERAERQADRNPSKAEGDEKVVEEALRNQAEE